MEPPKQKTTRDKIDKAKELKDEGTAFFKAGEHRKALVSYHKAWLYIKGLTSSVSMQYGGGSVSTAEVEEINALSLPLHNNLALCHIKVGEYERAVGDCNEVLKIDENNAKALFRRGQAYLALKDADRAYADLQSARKLEPADKSIVRELRRTIALQKKQEAQLKRAYAGMFKTEGSAKDNEPNGEE